MSHIRLMLVVAVAALLAVVPALARAQPEAQPRWWKGNLHTHSLWSDGDDFPEMIVAWYIDHGYDFLAISDRFKSWRIHVNASNIQEVIRPWGGETPFEMLQNNMDAVVAQRERTGKLIVPHVAHPNYRYSITPEHLVKLEGAWVQPIVLKPSFTMKNGAQAPLKPQPHD